MLTEVIITVDTEYSLDPVIGKLRSAGMNVQQVFSGPGIVIGTVEDHAVLGLSHVDGVLAVEEEGTKHQIASSPGS